MLYNAIYLYELHLCMHNLFQQREKYGWIHMKRLLPVGWGLFITFKKYNLFKEFSKIKRNIMILIEAFLWKCTKGWGSRKSLSYMQSIWNYIEENFKTVSKPTKSQLDFYYHYELAILNNISDIASPCQRVHYHPHHPQPLFHVPPLVKKLN